MDQPLAIVCFDEVKDLFNTAGRDPAMKYLALRRAMRHQTKVSDRAENKRFFGLLLDASSRITELSPPRERDPSLKFLRPGDQLFAPIYRLDTFDTFAGDAGTEYHLAKLIEAIAGTQTPIPALKRFFSFGRPL